MEGATEKSLKPIDSEIDPLKEIKTAALTKVHDILVDQIPAHYVYYGGNSPKILKEGLTAGQFAKRAGLEFYHVNHNDPWTQQFISVLPSFQRMKDTVKYPIPKDRFDTTTWRYSQQSVESVTFDLMPYDPERVEEKNIITFLVNPSVEHLSPDKWLEKMDFPKDLSEAFQKLKDKDCLTPGEEAIKRRIKPKQFFGIVLGDEVGEIVCYVKGFMETIQEMWEKGLIDKDGYGNLFEKLHHSSKEEANKIKNDLILEYWEKHQSADLTKNREYDNYVYKRTTDKKTLQELTIKRVEWILKEILPFWEQHPDCSIPIYGSSGDLYWPERISHDNLSKRHFPLSQK